MTWLPIVLGFVIGLVTNWLAILMLFRPHRRRRWLVVWPQGLVPREQEALAASVGEVVGTELLGPSQIEELLASDEGKARVGSLLDKIMEAVAQGVADRPLSELLGTLEWDAWADKLREYLEEGERRSALRARVVAFFMDRFADLSGQSVEDVLSPAAMDEIEKALAGRLRKTGLAEKAEEFVRKSRWIFTPSLVFDWLYSQEDRTAVERAVDELAHGLVETVRRQPFRHLCGLDDDGALKEAAEAAADRLLVPLADPATMRRMVDELRRRLGPWLETTPLALVGDVDQRFLADLRSELEKRIHALLLEHARPMVTALDLPSVVSRRVASVPVAQLESLVLDVTGRHLTWITIWGGILGALLGAVQILVAPR